MEHFDKIEEPPFAKRLADDRMSVGEADDGEKFESLEAMWEKQLTDDPLHEKWYGGAADYWRVSRRGSIQQNTE